MTAQEDNTPRVCHGCVGDPFLSAEVKDDGLRSLCSHCGETRQGMTLDELADRIHPVLQEEFVLTRGDPSRFGYSSIWDAPWDGLAEAVGDVIASMACVDYEIASALRKLLSERHGYSAIRDGEDDPYGVDAPYVERGTDTWEFQETWTGFCRDIRSRSRFFSNTAEAALRSIFGDLQAHSSSDNRPVIREIGPTDEETILLAGAQCPINRGTQGYSQVSGPRVGASTLATGNGRADECAWDSRLLRCFRRRHERR